MQAVDGMGTEVPEIAFVLKCILFRRPECEDGIRQHLSHGEDHFVLFIL
jgi:hypothetical protein